MFPIDAARWALSLEVIRIRRTGEKFEKKDLRRVRALVREISQCTAALARQVVAHVAVNETFAKAMKAPFFVPPATVPGVSAKPIKSKKSSKKKKGSKKKVIKC